MKRMQTRVFASSFSLTVLLLALATSSLAYNEAPMLTERFKSGELPPVEERLPENPAVAEQLGEIGQYGGTMRLIAGNLTRWNDGLDGLGAYENLLTTTVDGKVIGNLAERWEMSDDRKTLTLFLRKGLRWSDGEPFTVDDILFHVEDVLRNEQVAPTLAAVFNGSFLSPKGQAAELRKLDDYAFSITFAFPYPVIVPILTDYNSAQDFFYSPKHYLKRWHLKYNPDAESLAKEEGFESWIEAFNAHRTYVASQYDLNLPMMSPWIPETQTPNEMMFIRNPYYHRVDAAGNQLPYIDRQRAEIIGDTGVRQMRAVNGDFDLVMSGMSMQNYPLYQQGEQEGHYATHTVPLGESNELLLLPNYNVSDPYLHALFADQRFRIAISLAINRNAINETMFSGMAKPLAHTVSPTNIYYKDAWGQRYIEYAPERAKALFDEMGFTRNAEGFLLTPEGAVLDIPVQYASAEASITTPMLEMVRDDLAKVGLKITPQFLDQRVFRDMVAQNQHTFAAWQAERTTEMRNFIFGKGNFSPPGGTGMWGGLWDAWLQSGGTKGKEPPEEVKRLDALFDVWGQTEYMSEDYVRVAQEIYDLWSDLFLTIGTIGNTQAPMIVHNDLKNVYFPSVIKIRAIPDVNINRYQFYLNRQK